MRTTDPGDAARIELLLAELRLPAIKLVWASLAAQADKEGWPAGRFLAALAEHEIAERSRRRLERHLAGSPVAARQDPRQLRLRGCPSNQQGTGHGARRR
jgi:DNA replication protein DnaC